jgi:ABC-type transport system involved in multi-copper enzyme maturation permease subunit
MIELVRADVLRIVSRREIQLVIAALVLSHAIAFLQTFSVAKSEIDVATSVPPPPTDAAAFLEEQARYREAHFAWLAAPAAIRAMTSPGIPLLPAGVLFIAAIVMGSDFEWGTARTNILLAGSRRRFLLGRHLAVWGVCLVVVAGLCVLGVVLPVLLSMATRAEVGWRASGVPDAIRAGFGAALTVTTYGSITLAVVTLGRSVAFGLLAGVLFLGLDAVATSVIRHSGEVFAALTVSGSLAAASDPASTVPAVGFLVGALWTSVAIVCSVIAIERRDVIE